MSTNATVVVMSCWEVGGAIMEDRDKQGSVRWHRRLPMQHGSEHPILHVHPSLRASARSGHLTHACTQVMSEPGTCRSDAAASVLASLVPPGAPSTSRYRTVGSHDFYHPPLCIPTPRGPDDGTTVRLSLLTVAAETAYLYISPQPSAHYSSIPIHENSNVQLRLFCLH